MKNKFMFLCLSFCFLGILTGCGHNGFAYVNGKVFNLGYNTQTNAVGIQYYDAEVLSGGSRENTNITAELNRDTNISTNTDKALIAGRINKITYSTGIQINGYTVDLAETNPELAAEFLKKMKTAGKNTKYYLIKDNKLIEVDKTTYDNSNELKTKIDGLNQEVNTK